MKKWIVVSVVGGTLSMFQLGGAAPATSVAAPAAAVVMEPCPTCCPPEICNFNGPSFDGTTAPMPVAH